MFTQTTLTMSITVQALFLLFFLIPAPAQAQNNTAASFYLNRGQERYASIKLEKAISDFDRVLITEPRNSAILNVRGLTWLALKDYGLAIRDFNQAIKLTPELATAYAHRGMARLRQGHEAKASADFAKCIELDGSLRAYVEELKSNGAPRLTVHR